MNLDPARIVLDYAPEFVNLFAIETDAGEDYGWILECRSDERGFGTPLLWYSEAEADAWIKERCEESGCHGDQRVVGFQVAIRRDPPKRCDCCGEWGHLEPACLPDDKHNCVNGADRDG